MNKDRKKLAQDLEDVRRTLDAEMELLLETYPAPVVMHATITAAIRTSIDAGLSPADFCQQVADIVGLYCGEKPGGKRVMRVIELPGE